mgnify:CR=1 FL=1
MLIHQGSSELFLIVSELILIKVELIVSGNVGGSKFFRQNSF